MNRINKSILACIIIFFACLNVSGQTGNILNVSGNGQLIDMPTNVSFTRLEPNVFLPVKKPNTKTITIKAYKLKSINGDLERTRQSFTTTINYDSIGRIEKINGYTYGYNNNKVVNCKYLFPAAEANWKYIYDNNGNLQKMNYLSPFNKEYTYIYTLDANKNIVKIDQYYGAEYEYTHTCQFNAKGKKVFYSCKGKEAIHNTDLKEEIFWSYNNNGQLISIKTKETAVKQVNFWDTKTVTSVFEYKLQYGKDGNPSRCIEYEIGDLTIVKGGYEYEYSYTFYPTEEELRELARRQRVADSIRQVEIMQCEKERQRIEALKKTYQPCRFLFKIEDSYTSCVKKEQSEIEQEIIQLIDNKIEEISRTINTGKELQETYNKYPYNRYCITMSNICYICQDLDNLNITTHTEEKLAQFIAGHKALAKAYKKKKDLKPSTFLIKYIKQTL